MQINGIFGVVNAGNATLCPSRIGVHACTLGDDGDTAKLGCFEGEGQACYTAADDEEIRSLHYETLGYFRSLRAKFNIVNEARFAKEDANCNDDGMGDGFDGL